MATPERIPLGEQPITPPLERSDRKLRKPAPRPYREPDTQEFMSSESWFDGPIRHEGKYETKTRDSGERWEQLVPGTDRAILWEGPVEEDEDKKYRYLIFHVDKKQIDFAKEKALKESKPREDRGPRDRKYAEYVPSPPDEKMPNPHWYGVFQEASDMSGAWSPWSSFGELEDLGAHLNKETVSKIKNDIPMRLKFMRGAPETIQ